MLCKFVVRMGCFKLSRERSGGPVDPRAKAMDDRIWLGWDGWDGVCEGDPWEVSLANQVRGIKLNGQCFLWLYFNCVQ